MTLAEWREAKGLSLLDAAAVLGLSGTAVRNLENGTSPTMRTVDAIEAATFGAVRREHWPSEVETVAERLKVDLLAVRPAKKKRRRK